VTVRGVGWIVIATATAHFKVASRWVFPGAGTATDHDVVAALGHRRDAETLKVSVAVPE